MLALLQFIGAIQYYKLTSTFTKFFAIGIYQILYFPPYYLPNQSIHIAFRHFTRLLEAGLQRNS